MEVLPLWRLSSVWSGNAVVDFGKFRLTILERSNIETRILCRGGLREWEGEFSKSSHLSGRPGSSGRAVTASGRWLFPSPKPFNSGPERAMMAPPRGVTAAIPEDAWPASIFGGPAVVADNRRSTT